MTKEEMIVRMTVAEKSLKCFLRLCCISYYEHNELSPYYLRFEEYLNNEFILNDADTLMSVVTLFKEIYDSGNLKIIDGEVLDLIDLTKCNEIEDLTTERFCLAWGIFMDSIWTRLLMTYPELFMEKSGCGCDCDTSPDVEDIYSNATGGCGCGK